MIKRVMMNANIKARHSRDVSWCFYLRIRLGPLDYIEAIMQVICKGPLRACKGIRYDFHSGAPPVNAPPPHIQTWRMSGVPAECNYDRCNAEILWIPEDLQPNNIVIYNFDSCGSYASPDEIITRTENVTYQSVDLEELNVRKSEPRSIASNINC